MAVTTLRLTEGDRTLIIGVGPPAGPGFRPDLICTSLDLGTPTVREVITDRAGASGTIDRTRLTGSRAVSMELVLRERPAAVWEELAGWLSPALRPSLIIGDDEWIDERRVRLRMSQFGSALGPTSHIQRQVQLSWVAPDGVLLAAEPVLFEIMAEGMAMAGRSYPMTTPRTYPPAGAGIGQRSIDNPGSAWSDQIARLYGPCKGPRYTNSSTGETLIFGSDLVLGVGEFIEIDTAARTVHANGDPDASRLSYLDFVNSSWWRIGPGVNSLRYHPTAEVAAGCAASIEFSPNYL